MMDYSCYNDHDGVPYPVCPANSDGDYCDGSSDCNDDNYNEYCNCEAGRMFCEEGYNPCTRTCHAYITGYDSFVKETNPKRMDCETDFGDLGKNYAYHWSSCCSNDGQYYVNTGQVGGFDFSFENPGQTSNICEMYARSMSSLVCSPDQGKFVQNNTLRVCLSACETLLAYCYLPGEIFPSTANYTDAISLCEGAWSNYGSSCDSRPDGPLCRSGILNLEVVVNNENCLDLPPSPTLSETQKITSFCSDEESNGTRVSGTSSGIPYLTWLLIGIFVVLSWGHRYWKRKRSGQNEVEVAPGDDQNAVAQGTVVGGNAGESGSGVNSTATSLPSSSVPVVTVEATPITPVVSAVPAPAPVVTAVPEPVKQPGGTQTSTSAAASNEEIDESKLTFDQRMDLQSLEFKLKMDVITQEEFETMKKEILDG